MAIINVLGAVLVLSIHFVSPWPLTSSEQFEALVKRLDKPAIPGSGELLAHFEDIPMDDCKWQFLESRHREQTVASTRFNIALKVFPTR